MLEEGTCPRCGRTAPLLALSRSDNRTMVCSSCGTNEGVWKFKHPDQDVPPVTEELIW